MTDQVPKLAPTPARAVRLTRSLHWAAARRLVSQELPDRNAAATRLVTSAAAHGIDLDLTWGTVDPAAHADARVRQVCLAVLGSGRTAMLFLSEPLPGGDPGGPATARAERAACLEEACSYLSQRHRDSARVAQSLPEAGDAWAMEAYAQAMFTHVGNLSYMRRVGVPRDQPQPVVWPEGVRVVRADELGDRDAQDATLITALDRSYVDTLDCPELCGMRETADILQSHRSTGHWDPALWWIVMLNGEPQGCLLLNRSLDRVSVELVYLGLAPVLRGRGVGARLLEYGLTRLGAPVPVEINCAVDDRNAPALKIYKRLGFTTFGRRAALVRGLAARP